MGEGRNNEDIRLKDEVRLETDPEGLIESLAQLWDDAGREQKPDLRERLIAEVQERTKLLPQDVQDAVMLRAHVLMGIFKKSGTTEE